MADSRREAIIEAAKAVLEKPGKPTNLTMLRHRTREIDASLLPVGVILNGVEVITRQTAAPPTIDRELTFNVEFRAVGEPADEILDPMIAWAEVALLTDTDFTDLVRSINLNRIIWDQAEGKAAHAAASMEFSAQYRTVYGDPTTEAP